MHGVGFHDSDWHKRNMEIIILGGCWCMHGVGFYDSDWHKKEYE
jgi:hypothetical protein